MWKQVLTHFEQLEEVFDTLCIPYDPNVLKVHRLRILRRFGAEMQRIAADTSRDDQELKVRCTEALAAIHEQCSRGMRDPVSVLRDPGLQLVQLHRKPS